LTYAHVERWPFYPIGSKKKAPTLKHENALSTDPIPVEAADHNRLYDDLSTHQSLSPDGGGDDPECRDRLLFLTTNDEISRWFEVRDAHIC